MYVERYLIIGKKKYCKGSVRLSVNTPSIQSHEIAVKILLDVPDELFSKPRLEASISVPRDSVSAPVIEADVVNNIEEIISKELGVDLNISLIETTN